jgi:hypothetical protein
MERYKNGKIYKIVDNTNDNIYIGSTCEPTLARRLTKHRGHYKEYLKGGKYTTSFKILENNNYSIVLLEEFPCETKDQLLARERYYIENNECVNKVVPTRSTKEWKEQNRDKIIDYQKDYREQNQDKLNKKAKEYYEKNKEQKKNYYEQNKEKFKEKKKNYYEQNKDYFKKYQKQNQDKLKKYKNKKSTCECGGCYTNVNKATHLKSIKHQNYLNNKNKITSNDILNAEPL